MRQWFIKKYDESDYYIRKKAEYSFTFITIMLLAIMVIIVTELILQEDVKSSIIKGSVSSLTFFIVLLLIHLGKYESGINLMIMLGFTRLLMIMPYNTPLQFYTMLSVVLISVHTIYSRSYQLYFTNMAAMSILIAQTYRLYKIYQVGLIDFRTVTEAVISIPLFVSIVLLLNSIKRVIDDEIAQRYQLQRYVEMDPLTGIYNRRKVTQIFQNIQEEKVPSSIILLDIDDFKIINDTCGHNVGDKILVELSTLLSESLPDQYISRWGGEEFLILIVGDDECIQSCGEKLRILVKDRNFEADNRITISLGQTIVKNSEGIIAAVKRADKALYESKSHGKDRLTKDF